MRKICFITGTRADYGILAPVMREVAQNKDAVLQIVATNMHLSPLFGMTVSEIENDGFVVDAKIDSYLEGGTAASTLQSIAKVEDGLSEAFEKLQPDMVVILGDRYEAIAAATAAVVYNIPVAHIHGGETTEGAIDNAFRHAITKMSTLHFASTPEYVNNIISMGEEKERVFHSGAPGAIPVNDDYETQEEFYQKTGLTPGEKFIIFTMHPVTKLPDNGINELKATLTALDTFINQGVKILVTMPNSDPGHKDFFSILNDWIQSHPSGVVAVKSLGARLFHQAMDLASAIIGNSSAALIEAPSYRLPGVNVGIRQRGRAHGLTVIDVPADTSGIISAVNAAMSMEMKAVVMGMHVETLNPYFKEDSAKFIAEKLINWNS